MNILNSLKLFLLEQRLYGAFGRYNRYRRWCLERGAKTTSQRLAIAEVALSGPGVNTLEAQANELFLASRKARKTISQPSKDSPAMSTELHETGL
jgi:hypothetical protein